MYSQRVRLLRPTATISRWETGGQRIFRPGASTRSDFAGDQQARSYQKTSWVPTAESRFEQRFAGPGAYLGFDLTQKRRKGGHPKQE